MNYLTDNAFTAYVGIDWADSKHDICVQAAGGQQREFDCISHQVDPDLLPLLADQDPVQRVSLPKGA